MPSQKVKVYRYLLSHVLMLQGDTPADCMYFVEEGTVKIVARESVRNSLSLFSDK